MAGDQLGYNSYGASGNLKELADRAVAIACEQLRTSVQFKRPRMEEIKKNVDEYYGRVKKPLKGKFNIPVPVMPGFIDTIVANADERVKIKFGYNDIADYRGSLKMTSLIERDSSPQFGKWDLKDRGGKKLAGLSGVCVGKSWGQRPYRNNFDIVGYEDFHCEPMGGQDLENHMFLGQANIIRTMAHIRMKANERFYDKTQVALLYNRYTDTDYKMQDDLYEGSLDRFKSVGLNPEANSYVGQAMCNLTEWGMVLDGKRYYMVFDYKSKTWIKFCLLSDMFPVKEGEDELWPWFAWHTHEDPKLFWSKAPADDMRAVAVAIRTLLNQEIENRARRNAGQRAIDPRVFKDPSQLPWSPEGIVIADSSVKPISEGVYEFKTPELQGTINLVSWLDAYAGRKAFGITPDVEGAADTDKVGININNLQQTANRIGLMNKSYNDFYVGLGLRHMRNARANLDVRTAVKIMGEKGYEWEQMSGRDVNPMRDYDVVVQSGSSELEADMVKRKERSTAIALIIANPRLVGAVNPSAAVEEILKNGAFEDEEVKRLMDVSSYGDRVQISRAAQENQDIAAGKKVKPFRGATTGHMQHHLDFLTDQWDELSPKVRKALQAHMDAERGYMMENSVRMSRVEGLNPISAGMDLAENPVMPPGMPMA